MKNYRHIFVSVFVLVLAPGRYGLALKDYNAPLVLPDRAVIVLTFTRQKAKVWGIWPAGLIFQYRQGITCT